MTFKVCSLFIAQTKPLPYQRCIVLQEGLDIVVLALLVIDISCGAMTFQQENVTYL